MAVNLPITNISYQKISPLDWVRPSDWPTITDNANEFQALVADTGDATYTLSYVITGTGTTTINWGDGTTTTISGASTSTTTKTYTPGTGTVCSRGYTTFKIRVTKDAGITIGSIRFIGTAATFQSSQTSIGVLEVVFGNNIQTATNPSSWFAGFTISGSSVSFYMLEYVKLPATVTWTAMAFMFNNCYNLYVVVMPTSAANLTSMSSVFNGCYNLRDIVLPSNATGIQTLQNAFLSCNTLRSCILPTSLNSCTNLQNAFATCRSLISMTLPSINSCINLSGAFSTCVSLLWFRFTSLPAPVTAGTNITFTSIFALCSSLQNVYLPATCSSNAIYSAATIFSGCTSLRSFTFPINFNASVINSAFANCSNLFSVIFQSAMPNCTSFNQLFNACTQLQNVTLPSSVSTSGVDMTSMFNSCTSLPSIVIPSTYRINSLQTTFASCFSLKTAVIDSSQNFCTSLASTFNSCISLTNVTLPSSLNACNSLNGTFSACFSLQSVTFPATMNAVTNATNCFPNCISLKSVTMPTSMSACTTFEGTFQQCAALTTLTFPATISAATTTFANAISFCNNLKSVTFPTTRSTSLNTLSTLAYGCGQLTTMNNANLFGSTTGTPLVNGTSLGWVLSKLTSLSFSCPFSKLEIFGNNTSNIPIALNSLRLTNTSAGQWTGTSPQIYIQFTSLSTAALNTLFADIAAQGTVTSKTIDITGTVGAAGLTAADRLVLTSKGWTITG